MGVQREKYQLDYQYVTLNSRAVLPSPLLQRRRGRDPRKEVFTIRCAVFALSSSGGEGWREEALYMLPDAGQHCSATP